jgi:Fe-S-cluster-containing dehydrogenase component
LGLLKQGGREVEKMIWVEPGKCTGCRICEMTCSFRDATFNPAESRVRVVKNEEEGIDLPILCFHCPDPACAPACAAGAIERDPSGIVRIDPALCSGCRACLEECPYGAIRSLKDQVGKCHFCGGDPLCVKWCPTGALSLKTASFAEMEENRKKIQSLLKHIANGRMAGRVKHEKT